MLSELLSKADKLFKNPAKEKEKKAFTINYCLERFPQGWQFSVIDSWQNWFDGGFKSHFGLYQRPEWAVKAFLDYVEENGIDVLSLMEKW